MKSSNNNRGKYIVAILLLLVVGIGVGYAALATTLNINGTSKIDKVTWDVHFENAQATAGSATATVPVVIDSNTTTVNYEVSLTTPGQFYEFTVDVKNAGTLPAKLSAAPTLAGVSTAQDVYVNYTVTYDDGSAIQANDTLAANASRKIKVRVEYDKNVTASQLPTTAQTLNLTYSMNYVQG